MIPSRAYLLGIWAFPGLAEKQWNNYSPPYGHGSFLQAWSGLAARVLWEAEREER